MMELMLNAQKHMALFAVLCFCSTGLRAEFQCEGVLTESQQRGFEAMFTPPYSASLSHLGGAVTPANMAKRLGSADLNRLYVKKPVVANRAKLSEQNAQTLQTWLNANASATVPGWVSTTVGIVVPEAWVGRAADVFVQLMNGAGDAGRLKVANIAGTVSQGGWVGVTEQVANDAAGKRKFTWSYVYQANLNGRLITTPLIMCSSDVVASGQN